jgi:hypothetical protein
MTHLTFYTTNPKEMSLLIIAKVLENSLDLIKTHSKTIQENLLITNT